MVLHALLRQEQYCESFGPTAPITGALVLTDASALTNRTVLFMPHLTRFVVPTIQPHGGLHIPTIIDGGLYTHSRTGLIVPTIRPHAVYSLHIRGRRWGKLLSLEGKRCFGCFLIIPLPPWCTLCVPCRVNFFISFKLFIFRKLDDFHSPNIWQCWNSRTWPTLWRHFEILSKSIEELPLIPNRLQCEKRNRRGSKK